MKLLVFGLLMSCSMFCISASADNTICSNAHMCELRGLGATNKGDFAAAQNFFEEAVGYAEDANNKVESINSYNNLILIYIKMHDYKSALKWAQVALTVDPTNKETGNYLNKIVTSYPLERLGNEVNGVYVKYAGRNYWDQLQVSGVGSKRNNFNLTLYRIGIAWRTYGPSQIGEVHGLLTKISNNEFVYKSDPDFPLCRIYFKFARNTVILNQDDDCGFGYGLQAAGAFRRIAGPQKEPKEGAGGN